MADTAYNRVIRKLVIGFGKLFDDITLVRYNPNMTEQQRVVVPIVYANKEKYLMRLEGDPSLDKKVQTTLPVMSFEMNGLTYDASRKQNTNWKSFAHTPTGVIAQYNPVPYNFDFSLNLYVRNVEDGTQILEHILPFFTPDYTIKLNLIPEMGIIKEVPIILNSAQQEIDYEGDKVSETRMIIWTLNFTVKGFIFGKTSSAGLVTHSITNILRNITDEDIIAFNMANVGTGKYKVGELVYQGFSPANATATAKVVEWSNNILKVKEISGNFVSNNPVTGFYTNANYYFNSYQVNPITYATIDVTSNPSNPL